MVIALTPGETWEYVCKCDRGLPEEEQTVWVLKTLSGRQYKELEDKITSTALGSGELNFNIGSHKYRAIKMGLAGVRNFRDGAGNEIEFKTVRRGPTGAFDEVSPEFVERIPPAVIHELADAIFERQVIDGETEKN